MLTTLANFSPAALPGFGFAAAVLIAWLPIAFVIVRCLPAGRGVMVAYLAGWMFLPQAGINTPFVIYDKAVAVSLGVLLAAIISHPRPLLAFRPRWIDFPMGLWCIVGVLSTLSNGLPIYDALAASTRQVCVWGIPYLLGRAYLTQWSDARDLARAMFISGLVYAPLCILEIRLSPFLHYMVYRTWQHSEFMQAWHDGGWRPMVFMQHGLAVGMFMAAASLMGWWLWWTGVLREYARLPVFIPLVCLMGTTVWVRSTGALALLAGGVIALYLTRKVKVRIVFLAVMLIPTIYVLGRTVGEWTGETAVSYAARTFGPDRAQSLEFRFDNENAYVEHDRAKPLLGYGPGYTFMVFFGEKPLVVDSLWIITLSVNGWVGLAALLAMFAAPVGVLMWRIPKQHYNQPVFAGAIGLAMLLSVYMLDNLVNAMFNPVFVVALGCIGTLTGAAVSAPARRVVRRRTAAKLPPVPMNVPTAAPTWAADGAIDPRILAPDTISFKEKR